MTGRAKAQWQNYKAMLDDARTSIDVSALEHSCTPKKTTTISGIPSHLDIKQINAFHYTNLFTFPSLQMKIYWSHGYHKTDEEMERRYHLYFIKKLQ